MAQQDNSTDLLMRFVLNGVALEAESSSELEVKGRSRDPLLEGFQKGRMFEVTSFTFGTGIKDDDDGAQPGAAGKAGNTAQGGNQGGNQGSNQTGRAGKSALGSFKKWRSGNGGRGSKYPADVHPVTFNRMIDRASSTLLQNCINRKTYDVATLVKRKAAGGPAAGEAYLRFDFQGVLMVGIDWDADDLVKEKCTFICRKVILQYKPQLPDGSLGSAIQGSWSMQPTGDDDQ